MTDNTYCFRFESAKQKQEFKIAATIENKSMNEILGEFVVRYLSEKKGTKIA
jgi:hypothetical protein